MNIVGFSALTGELSTGLSIGVVAGGVVALVVVGGIAWWAWRCVKHRVDRGHRQWQRTMLRLRAVVLPSGPRREIVRMRLALQDNLAQTQRVFGQSAGRDAIPRSLRDLLSPLERLASGLDDQLRLWQTEPDAALISGALPELRERAHRLIEQALAMRTSALQILHDADRLTRGAAEEELRAQLGESHAQVLATPALHAQSGQMHDHPIA